MKIRKKDKKKLVTLLCVLVLSLVSLVFPQFFESSAPAVSYNDEMSGAIFSFHVIDVGQGSAALIKTDEKAILIDSGESFNGKMVLDYLKNEKIENLDLLVATHPHSDHYGAVSDVLSSFDIERVILPVIPERLIPDNKTWESLMMSLAETKAEVTYVDEKESFDLGNGVKLELLGPFVKDSENINNLSLCFKVTAGDVSFLITGDGETAVEDALRENEDIDCDVLVAGHHGSATSSRPKFLSAVTPTLTAISVGEGNKYNLPKEEVVERLLNFGEVYRTDKDGSIVFLTDGKEISVFTENQPTNSKLAA